MSTNFTSTVIRTDESLSESYRTLVAYKPKNPKWANFSKWVTFQGNTEEIEDLKAAKLHEDDVIVCGFPRSGTSMMQEMIWLIMNNFNFEKAKEIQRGVRVPMIEFYDLMQSIRNDGIYTKFDDLPRPRTFKSHVPVQILPDDIWVKKPRIIYISRNVKDVALSFHYFSKDYYNYKYELEEFLQYFMDGALESAPYREHVLNFKNIPDYENILYLTYEGVTGDMRESIKKVAEFLGKEVSDENMEKLLDHLNFSKIKTNTGFNNESFLQKLRSMNGTTHEFAGHARKGKSGGYKSEMSQEFIDKFDRWMDEKLESGFEKAS